MDKDFENTLKELISKSRELARHSEALKAESKALIERYRIAKKKAEDLKNKLRKI